MLKPRIPLITQRTNDRRWPWQTDDPAALCALFAGLGWELIPTGTGSTGCFSPMPMGGGVFVGGDGLCVAIGPAPYILAELTGAEVTL